MPVAILGATGTVGQKCIALLDAHPWFRVAELVASDRSAGRTYGAIGRWKQEGEAPPAIAAMTVKKLADPLASKLLFSCLDSSVAGEAESAYARAGHIVISNASNHRMDADVPLVIPEINCEHLGLLAMQNTRGKILTNPNCSTIALTMALAPIQRAFGIKSASVTTLQAVSGAGYPGVASLDIMGNVIPYINGEEDKMEEEPQKILGTLQDGVIQPAEITISAQCTRIPVIDGHTELVSLRLNRPATIDEITTVLREFRGEAQRLSLPSAPRAPIHVTEAENRPQVLRDVNAEHGMAITVGRVRPCPVNDIKFVVLGHNTVRGAAGAAILNAEACYKRGDIA